MSLMSMLVVAAVLSAIIVTLWSRFRSSRAHAPAETGGASLSATCRHTLAYISGGKLFCLAPGRDLREVQSPYVQTVMDRMERSRQRDGWKEGTAFAFSHTGRNRHQAADGLQMQATAAQFLDADRMLYFLKDDSFGGLFEQNLVDGTEKRLVHKQNLVLEDLRLSPDGARLLCAQHARNGAANVAMMDADGSRYLEVTGGDTEDTAPCWVPGQPELVMFQSAGLARNPQGFVVARGPASIQIANTSKGSLATVLESPRHDYLQPRVAADGTLYCIRRPYEAPHYGPRNLIVDAAMFPFRLLRALFHYLNFFSMMYTRKPLTSANGPAVQADIKNILLQGRRIDAEKALRNERPVHGVPSLVPSSWQLVSRSRQGDERVLATNVASYDIGADGTIVYSNGRGVFVLGQDGSAGLALRDELVAEVFAASA